MLVDTSQSHSYRRVLRGSSLLGRELIMALAMLSIITGLGISELTARSGIEPSGETVNRILKGDRWSPAFRIQTKSTHRPRQTNTPPETASGSRLPIGCEPLVSALAHPQLARIAGRCVS
jgi:hypothetical protein